MSRVGRRRQSVVDVRREPAGRASGGAARLVPDPARPRLLRRSAPRAARGAPLATRRCPARRVRRQPGDGGQPDGPRAPARRRAQEARLAGRRRLAARFAARLLRPADGGKSPRRPGAPPRRLPAALVRRRGHGRAADRARRAHALRARLGRRARAGRRLRRRAGPGGRRRRRRRPAAGPGRLPAAPVARPAPQERAPPAQHPPAAGDRRSGRIDRLDAGRVHGRLHVAGAGLYAGARQPAQDHRHPGLLDRQPDAAERAVRRLGQRHAHRAARPQDHHHGHRPAVHAVVRADRVRAGRLHDLRGARHRRPVHRRAVSGHARLPGRDDPAGHPRHARPAAHHYWQHRHLGMFPRGNVPEMGPPGAVRRLHSGAVPHHDVVRAGDTALVHFARQDEGGRQVAALAAREGRQHRRRAQRHHGAHHRGAAHSQLTARPALAALPSRPGHLPGAHVLPADVRHQRRHLLLGQHLQDRRQHHRRQPEHHRGRPGQLRRHLHRQRDDRPAGPQGAALHQQRADDHQPCHPGGLLLHEGRDAAEGGAGGRTRLAAAGQLHGVRGGVLRRLGADPVAVPGRGPAGPHPRQRRLHRHRIQLGLHLCRHQDLHRPDPLDRRARHLLAVLRVHGGRTALHGRLHARDQGQDARGHREEPLHRAAGQHEEAALGLAGGRLSQDQTTPALTCVINPLPRSAMPAFVGIVARCPETLYARAVCTKGSASATRSMAAF